MNPYAVTEQFEWELASYVGAPFCVAVSSCTAALHLACEYFNVRNKVVRIPKFTYVGVAQSIMNAGGIVAFGYRGWEGDYTLDPYPIVDSARLFTSGMYASGEHRCVSFHASKTLGIEMGGAIFTDDVEAYDFYRAARFDGRTPGQCAKHDTFTRGWHYILPPSIAAAGLLRLNTLPLHNPPLPNSDYPDLSLQRIFQ